MIIINLGFYIFARGVVVLYEVLYGVFESRKTKLLLGMLKNSQDYKEWIDVATELDILAGKGEIERHYFDVELVTNVVKKMKRFMSKNDVHALSSLLQNSVLKKDFGGIENPLIYSNSYITVHPIIPEYFRVTGFALDYICRHKDLSLQEKQRFLKKVSVNFGKSALCLSGGAFLAFFHCK